MNTSIAHLPEEVQEKLSRLVDYIRDEVPETQYIILYGSYARGDYVEYDQREEYGLRTCYQSDFDIVVLTPKRRGAYESILRRLRNSSHRYIEHYPRTMRPRAHYLPMFIEEFNKAITDGRYLFTDIAKEGIILYNSGTHEIAPIRELNYSQILKLANEYFDKKYTKAEIRLKVARFLYNEGNLEDTSFDLHQATENYLLAALLTASLYAEKTHNIIEIIEDVSMFTPVIAEIFRADTVEGKRLLNLLQDAYVQSRYNKDFVIAKEDLDKLMELIERLRIVTEKFCLETIAEHERRAIG